MRWYFLFVLVGTWLLAPHEVAAQTAPEEKALADYYWRTGHYQTAVFFAQLPENRAKKEAPKESPQKPTALEQLIAEALKNNPDIAIAEVKVREAEAQLVRTRTLVAAEISSLHAEIQAVQATIDAANARYERMKGLHAVKSIEAGLVEESKASLMKAKAELAVKQAKLPYLLGKKAASFTISKAIDEHIRKAWEQNVKDTAITDDEFIRRAMLDILGRPPRVDEIVKYKALPAQTRRTQLLDELQHAIAALLPPAEKRPSVDSDSSSVAAALNNPVGVKLRKALDMHIKFAGNKVSQSDAMDFVLEHLNGVNLHVRHKAAIDRVITVTFKDSIPLGAFVQFLEDELGCFFILRDYGVVVVTANDKLPPGALRVTDFWKQSKAVDARESKLEIARTQVKGPLTSAIQAYYLKHNAIWPPSLDTLLQQDKFGRKYLENADSITDPWGKRYQYDLNGPKNNGTKPDIWTIAPGGAVIGNWDENEKPAPKENDAKFPNPPPVDIKGTIENVDPKDPTLVQISVGSAAGLKVGHTMDAYRLTPAPKYLGMLRITNVTNEKSVGRILAIGNGGIPNVRAGDQVASQLAKEKK